jgi:glutathione S-transferase
MTIELSAFRWVPAFAQGYVRDLRVRWALEEAGIPYEATLVNPTILASQRYREWQPFGQVPAFRDENVEMFESGAIVLHIAEQSDALCPRDPAGRARMTSWVIAALNSVEPHVESYAWLDVIHVGEPWVEERRPQLLAVLKGRLEALATWLGDNPYLADGRFTAGDLIMTTVLRELVDCGVLADYPTLDAYRRRCEARPAFARAMEAQMQPFRENAPA